MLFENNMPYMITKVLVSLLGTLGMMCSTAQFISNRRKIFVILAVFFLWTALSSAAIIYFGGYLTFSRVFVFTISFPAVFIQHRITSGNSARLVFTRATHILFSLYVTASITLLTGLIHGTMLTDILFRVLAYALVIMMEFLFLRHPFLRLANTASKGWGVLSMVPCALILFAVALAFYPVHYTTSRSSIVLIYILGAVIVVIYFSIFQYLNMQYRFQMQEHNQDMLKLQIQSLKKKTAETAAAEEKARIDRHDARHRLQTIASLVENGEKQAVLDYIDNSISQMNPGETARYCADPVLNATLSSYFEQAAAEKISLEASISVPDSLPVDSAEISIVFANALENAINACKKLPEKSRKIICKCIYKPVLMLEISNPFHGTVNFSSDGLPISEEEGHGIGTRSIMVFCKKYDAFYNFTAKDGWFRLTVAL